MKIRVYIAAWALAALVSVPAAHGEDAGQGKGRKKEGFGQKLTVLDENRDGKISKSEFLAPQERKFAKADVNKDGMLDNTEQKQFFQERKPDGRGKGDIGAR